MGYMKTQLIKEYNEKLELYYEIKKIIQSKYDVRQKVDNILAKCKRFEHRNPI